MELAGRNVTCNAIAPGFIETDMTNKLPEDIKKEYLRSIPLGRYGAPTDIAELAAFLASDQAAYITGAVIAVDGGLSM
jgi:3-oxoacyl-[acyl-carrier protein] reductase